MIEAGTFAASVERLARLIHALQFSTGLNPSQWEALRYLARANRFSASPSALARYLGITKGTVSQTIIALESKGYVNRVRGRPDGRSVHLELTPKGWCLLDNDPLCAVDALGKAIPEGERDAAMKAINGLLESLCKEKGSEGFGVCGDCSHLEAKPCAQGKGDDCACKLANEPLKPADQSKICVNFTAAG
jgi:DNA-binding MarR family transcriptional regulator